MTDILLFRQLASTPSQRDNDGELRFVFADKWQHFFEGEPTWSETRWVFERADWSIVFLEILDPVTLEWVCGAQEEVLDVEFDLTESDSRFLKRLEEWRLSESDDLPDWACTRTQFQTRSELATRERLAESRRRNAVRLRLPSSPDVCMMNIRFARPHGDGIQKAALAANPR